MKVSLRAACAGVALMAASCGAFAAEPQAIRITAVVELSGAGAAAGSSFKNGVELAVRDINAIGGVLNRRLELTVLDTRSEPVVAQASAQKAVSEGAFAVFGPVFSGSAIVSMAETWKAEVPNFVGAEAAAITQQGNPYVFRTSFTQAISMPKVAYYMSERAKFKRVAAIYTDNEFGRGGIDALKKALAPSITRLGEEVAVQPGQPDVASAVGKVVDGGHDAVFVYTNEDEAPKVLRELRRRGWTKPIVGESTLANQKVIDAAGPAAEGVVVHVGLTADAPVPAIRAFKSRYEAAYRTAPDHNAMKGYSGVHVLKAAIERAGRVDAKAVASTLHALKVNTDRYPGALMYTEFSGKGDLDRMSFLVQVRRGRQEVIDFMPPLLAIPVSGTRTAQTPRP